MLPSTIAGALVAAHQSDARKRAEQARYLELARAHAAQYSGKAGSRQVQPPAHRRLRWWRRPVIRPA